jgi:thiamine-monophosphate kinase
MGELLLTVDVVVEGVHADLGLVGLDDFGWRAVSTAVSDIAAMGGCADHLLVSIAAPPSTDLALLYTGIIDASSHHGVSVVGGDLSTAKKIAVTVAVAGHMPEGEKPVLRSGATPGDAIVVTGPLGAAGAGLRILKGRTTARPGSSHGPATRRR